MIGTEITPLAMTDAATDHYGRIDLAALQAALDTAHARGVALALEDVAALDQLHIGGLDATRSLAQAAELRPGMRVLDVGGGLGVRYTCRICGKEVWLFEEEGRWFLEK